MLQWMGGSRRKVTTSRKSAQKRQKQYFEQRKRQQQQLQTTRVDGFSDGVYTSSKPQTNNRSLDILSLLNLSTVVQDHNSSCCRHGDNSGGGAITVNSHIATKCMPEIQNNKGTPREPIEFEEARNPSGYQVGTVYPKKSAFGSMVLSTALDCQNIDLVGNNENADASVFELLGDDGPNDNLVGSLVHESHVAFSVEATSNFLDVNFLDEDCGITWKKRPLKMDGSSADYWNLGNHEISNSSFEGPYSQNFRVTEKATGKFNFSESPAPCSKQRRLQNDHDFSNLDGSWYPPARRNRNVKYVTHAPGWSCCVTEDAGENLSLSEESCSSSAVRGRATKNPTSMSVARQNIRRHGSDKWGVEDIYVKDRHYAESFHDVNKINGPGNFTKMGNPSSLLPAHLSNSTYSKNLFPKDSLFEEGYISADSNSGFCSFLQTSGAKICASSGPKHWNKDPFGLYSLREFHANDNSSLEISKHDVLHERPSSNASEKVPFSKPYCHVNPYEMPIFTTIGSVPSKPNLYMDSKVESRPQYSFPAVGSHGDTEVLHASVEESVAKDLENRSEETQPSEGAKFEVQNDICIGSNDLSSENERPLAASVSKDDCSDCKEASRLTPEMDDRKVTVSPELAEEISSSAKILDKFGGNIDGKE